MCCCDIRTTESLSQPRPLVLFWCLYFNRNSSFLFPPTGSSRQQLLLGHMCFVIIVQRWTAARALTVPIALPTTSYMFIVVVLFFYLFLSARFIWPLFFFILHLGNIWIFGFSLELCLLFFLLNSRLIGDDQDGEIFFFRPRFLFPLARRQFIHRGPLPAAPSPLLQNRHLDATRQSIS